MRWLLAVALIAAGVTFGCDTGNPRCNLLLAAQENHANSQGWRIDCAPPFPPPPNVIGWANFTSTSAPVNTIYLWPNLMTDLVLRKTADHELGHVRFGPGSSEWLADGWAWCFDPLFGVGYFNQPTDCRPYL